MLGMGLEITYTVYYIHLLSKTFFTPKIEAQGLKLKTRDFSFPLLSPPPVRSLEGARGRRVLRVHT